MKLLYRSRKGIALFLAFTMLSEVVAPTAAYALTGGPSQPEVQGFEPVGTSDMVDLFSGDFKYNIPLIDVDGYPINISYSSSVGMDQEAGWVGLGWTLNAAGVINRNMRGLPDDFSGDQVVKQLNMKDNNTYSGKESNSFIQEVFGLDMTNKLSIGSSKSYVFNNYTGFYIENGLNLSVGISNPAKGSLNAGLGLTSSSANGISISPSVSFGMNIKKAEGVIGSSAACSFNSRTGLKALTLGGTLGILGESQSGSYSMTFGVPTYVPQVDMSMQNSSFSLRVMHGKITKGIDRITPTPVAWTKSTSKTRTGSFSTQRLASNTLVTGAYGYLNTEKGSYMSKVLLDFNREKDGGFSLNTPALPLTNFTYDVYSVSGQGLGGVYRPYRGDKGTLFDCQAGTTSDNVDFGLEITESDMFKYGMNISGVNVSTTSGLWSRNNPSADQFQFQPSAQDDPFYEPYYFKASGDKSVDPEPELYGYIDGNEPSAPSLRNAGGFGVAAVPSFNGGASRITRGVRQKRNEAISILNRKEAEVFGLDMTDPYGYQGKPHHIGEITALRTDGARYVFGLPAYNKTQEETSFSMGKTATSSAPLASCTSGLITYQNDDNSIDNSRGIDHFYSNTILPGYAHSFLLTAVLAPDYVDFDGIRGPSRGDMGNYTKFRYKRIQDYKWRIPVDINQANYNEGLKSVHTDNQANYIYGEKELLFLEYIETKNYVAIFSSSPRHDGHGVIGKNGGRSNVSTLKLDKITLYTRPEYQAHQSNLSLATPVKEVHFVYDYTLCPHVPNNSTSAEWVNGFDINADAGKLTLKKIFFTYGKSNRARLSPYEFTYSSSNPQYKLKEYDRWGNYKPNDCTGNGPTNSDFPYVDQYDRTLADEYASSWVLKNIKLPSGGEIQIAYEADDYAYVQNRAAMQMFRITGISHDPALGNLNSGDRLMDGGNKLHLFFKLNTPIRVTPNALSTYEKNYLNFNKDELYFKFLVNLSAAAESDNWEYVTGYASRDGFGLRQDSWGVANDYYTHGSIKLKQVDQGNASSVSVNPISKAAWQFCRTRIPQLANDGTVDPTDWEPLDILLTLFDVTMYTNLLQMLAGPNGYLNMKQFGKEFNKDHSWIRLLSPEKKKIGGGSRVKEVRISDAWNTMTTNQNAFSYGQQYFYTTMEDGREISSGVASYEPMVGGDENPFKTPLYFGDKEENPLIPDDQHYMEFPFGESFFPSPGVGYSKVKVQNIQHPGVKRNATGYTVNEFYTAKDFPTITKRTDVNLMPMKTKPILRLFKIVTYDYMNASQGYVIELNDMHGKPLATKVYAEELPPDPADPKPVSEPISSVQYLYKSEPHEEGSWKLNNLAKVIHNDGRITEQELGMDYDFVADSRQQQTLTVAGGLQVNLAVIKSPPVPPPVPLPIPTLFPDFNLDHTRFRSTVYTKVINRVGLLEETIAFDLGSRVATKNLAYDAETGEVLLTQIVNEHDDPVYSFTYPAHWYYDGMGPSYRNIGLEREVNFNNAGAGYLPHPELYYVPGDELGVMEIDKSYTRLWVTEVKADHIKVINAFGSNYANNGSKVAKVLRSGRRNLQNTPMGNLASLTNPLDNFSGNVFTKVLQAGVTEFSEDWRTFCDCYNGGVVTAGLGKGMYSTNPYVTGTKGLWRLKRGYLFLADREASHKNYNSDTRNDGTYMSFNPFWRLNGHKWDKDPANWTWSSEITQFNPAGMEIENRDALNRFSSALYGYSITLPIAVASNAQYREIGFTGFEDNGFITCASSHFNFNGTVTGDYFHTGRNSLKVNPGQSTTVTKAAPQCP